MSGDENFLRRWSRLKSTSEAGTDRPTADVAPVETGAASPSADTDATPPQPPPPVESLTPESDFTPFMQADVDPTLRRSALRKLFEDPRFNVMDGLDVYIDDYSKPDPLPEGWLEKLNMVARLGAFQPQEKQPEPTAEALPAPGDAGAPPALPEAETPHAPNASNVAARPAAHPEKDASGSS
jgi:hypothetical protein